MQHAQLLENVRSQVRHRFRSQGGEDFADWCETILVHDGFYCGRCFTCQTRRAVWFVEEEVIKFYGSDGEYVASQSTRDLQPPDSAVA